MPVLRLHVQQPVVRQSNLRGVFEQDRVRRRVDGKQMSTDAPIGMDRAARRRFYASAHWKRVRAIQLAKAPLCEDCHAAGRITPANTVDHRRSLASGGSRDHPENLRSLCASHHSAKTRRVDVGGQKDVRPLSKEVDPNTGLPIDPGHSWNGGSEDPYGDADFTKAEREDREKREREQAARVPDEQSAPPSTPSRSKLTFATPPAPTPKTKPRDDAKAPEPYRPGSRMWLWWRGEDV
jgi:5-methylcytosine-specific restriction protein A